MLGKPFKVCLVKFEEELRTGMDRLVLRRECHLLRLDGLRVDRFVGNGRNAFQQYGFHWLKELTAYNLSSYAPRRKHTVFPLRQACSLTLATSFDREMNLVVLANLSEISPATFLPLLWVFLFFVVSF